MPVKPMQVVHMAAVIKFPKIAAKVTLERREHLRMPMLVLSPVPFHTHACPHAPA